ncbi:MAG: phosphoglycerate dehydrogenase [Candidatus Omnitrophota bacterium]|nr:MAG: phosphoglycerate dehydrogenase [Candidatus Omnitrophota bacterium]
MKVLVSDKLAPEGLAVFKKEKGIQVDVKTGLSHDELKKIIRDYDGLIVRSSTKVTKDIIAAGKKLKIIGRAGVGLDNIDVEAASRGGIVVMNAPGGNTISTAEHTLSMILALSRNIPLACLSLREGRWDRKKFMGVELYGKILGVIGLGRIGIEVARRAMSFGMKVLAFDPYLSLDKVKTLNVEAVDLKKLLKQSDYISIHTPLTDETKHLISDKEMSLMKKGVRLVNCARGGIIDEEALFKNLKSGRIAGCALDVYEKEPPLHSPLLKLDNVVATPHLGASTEEAQVHVAIDMAKQISDGLMGRGMCNAVNAPCLRPEVAELLKPYVALAERLGSLQSQLVSGQISRVKIEYRGDIGGYETAPITVACIKGLLTPFMGDTVNYVNACVLAKDRGIAVEETKTERIENFANLIAVKVATSKEELDVWGTIFAREDARIVKIDKYYVEAHPKGYMLIIRNRDLPGIVGHIGTLLGQNRINIAEMTFGREKPGGAAITVLNVDSSVPAGVLEKIKKAKNIFDAKLIKL